MEEEFVLLGGQGEERITPSELTRIRGSIPNEVFTSFGARLPRTYLGAAALESDTVSGARSTESEQP
jgi:hypothetical protein